MCFDFREERYVLISVSFEIINNTKIMYLLTWKKHIFTTKSNTKKPLLKLLDIIMKEQHCGVNKVCFYVNNLPPSIENTKYTIFMHHWAYSNNPIYLILFPITSTTKGSQFSFVNIDFFLWETFFLLLLCFCCLF